MFNLTVGRMSFVAFLLMLGGFGAIHAQDPAAPEPGVDASNVSEGVAWGDVDVTELSKDLSESISSGDDDESKELRDIVDTSVPPKVVKNFPKSPFVAVVFPLREGVVESKELQQRLRDYVQNHLELNVLTEEAINQQKVEEKFKPQALLVQTKKSVQAIRVTPEITPEEPRTPKVRSNPKQPDIAPVPQPANSGMADDPFQEPEGLFTPASELLQTLGYSGCCCGANCFPFTPEMSYEVAIKAYQHGLFQDAKALAQHALKSENRPEYVYLEALSEFGLGECHAALQSAKKLSKMRETNSLKYLKERLAGPRASRLQALLKAMPGRLPYPPAPAPEPYDPSSRLPYPTAPVPSNELTPTPPPPSI